MGGSLQLDLDQKALFRFFRALERQRRQVGISGAASLIEPERCATLVELVLSLNFELAWGGSERLRADATIMTLMFAPLLAETDRARDALRRALEESPPGAFNLAITDRGDQAGPSDAVLSPVEKMSNDEAVGSVQQESRANTWASAFAALAIAAVVVAYVGKQGVSLSCWFRDQGQCTSAPTIAPGTTAPRAPQRQLQEPLPVPINRPSTEQTGAEVYSQFLRTAAQSLARQNSLLTPRELAQDFAATDPGGPPPQQILEAMFAAAPRHPDLPLPSNTEGAAVLRRYTAAAAAVISQKDLEEMLHLATSAHDGDGQQSNEAPVSKVLADFANQHASPALSYRRTVTQNVSLIRWTLFAVACTALIGVLAALWRTLNVHDAQLVRTLGNIKGEQAEIKVQALGLESIDAPRFAGIAKKMSRRRPADGRRLDADRTIGATIERLGFFVPLFKPKSASTDYVFLLKRDARDDHARDRFAAIVNSLRLAGVRATRYDFSHDPRILFPGDEWNWERALTLAHLSNRHPDARLILVTDGVELVIPANLQPFAWLRSLESLARCWPAHAGCRASGRLSRSLLGLDT